MLALQKKESYINKDWKLNSRLIDIELLEKPFSADHLLGILIRVLTYFDIENKI